MARIVALISNGWSLFVRLADPNQHTEAITSRPLLLYGKHGIPRISCSTCARPISRPRQPCLERLQNRTDQPLQIPDR